MTKEMYRLCEVVADIAYIAGTHKCYSGDSREDVRSYLKWAEEFEKLHPQIDGDDPFDGDYIGIVEAFALAKLGDPQLKPKAKKKKEPHNIEP